MANMLKGPRMTRVLGWLLGMHLLFGPAGQAAAEIIVHVGDARVAESQSGFVDVYFEVHDGPYDLRAYMIELNLSGPAGGVRLTHWGEPADALAPGQLGSQVPGRPVLPGPTAAVWGYFSEGVPLYDGAGLLRVYFETDLGSAGEYQVSIDPSLLRTNFSNAAGDLLSDLTGIRYTSGRLEVVPEPAMAALLGMSAACLAAVQLRRSRRRREGRAARSPGSRR
jgi:hypothetical protein